MLPMSILSVSADMTGVVATPSNSKELPATASAGQMANCVSPTGIHILGSSGTSPPLVVVSDCHVRRE